MSLPMTSLTTLRWIPRRTKLLTKMMIAATSTRDASCPGFPCQMRTVPLRKNPPLYSQPRNGSGPLSTLRSSTRSVFGQTIDFTAEGPSRMKTDLPRQRCPDFEELGYCLRGDMCPMEHGANCIMVEDVQSLLELKLMGVQPDPVPKPVTLKDPLRLSGLLASVVTALDADVYDPDQPLWANGQLVTSPNYTSAGTATAPDADFYNPDQPLCSNGQPMASPDRTSASTATGASTNDPSYHPDPGPSVWGCIGN